MSTAVSRLLEELRNRGGLRGVDIANIVDVSPPTVSRWGTGQSVPSLHTQEMMADLNYLVNRLSDFYTADEARLWLHARHPMLEHERPVDLVHSGRTKEVLAVIDRLASGAYV